LEDVRRAGSVYFGLSRARFVASANFLYITALRTGAISVVAPFRYTGALFAMIAGFIVWRDVLDVWGIAGTIFIIGSGLYTFYASWSCEDATTASAVSSMLRTGDGMSSGSTTSNSSPDQPERTIEFYTGVLGFR